MTRFAHSMPFGAEVQEDGSVRFRLWAPSVEAVRLVLDGGGELDMEAQGDGWFERVTDRARAGAQYAFRLPDGLQVPDPASRFQSGDVHGFSTVVDPRAYVWKHPDWTGRPWEEVVLYELHLGTFSPEGSYDGLRRRLDHLAGLGVTAVELMPLAECPGDRNWGYDGVLPFAPEAAYGRPEDLKALIDEAHERGLMVFLDVVYNHFGPEGNYLGAYARNFFTERHHTPWGDAVNFDGADAGPVRDFFIHNALYWLCEYRFDGLRFDAVHAIMDDSNPDILVELAEIVRRRAASTGRHIHLVLENGANIARYLERDHRGRVPFYNAQWNDDYHHAAHVTLTGESGGYYRDYADDPVTDLGRALAEGFIYQGQDSAHEGGPRGTPSAHLPPGAFVNFLQNHDQIGNRAFGERLAALVAPDRLRALMAVTLLAPHPPLLFMGEEWGCAQPFLYFVDFHGELADSVREGRRREFGHFPEFADPVQRERIPDPTARGTFEASRLDWSALERPEHAEWLAFTRGLLECRRQRLLPVLPRVQPGAEYRVWDGRGLSVRWPLEGGGHLALLANLGDGPRRPPEMPEGETIHRTGPEPADGSLPGWSVLWTLKG